MKTERAELEFNDNSIVGVLTTPAVDSPAVVFMLHGGPGGSKEGPSDLFVKLAASLADADIASFRFDFAGEGESKGDYINTSASDQVAQCKHVIAWLRSRGFKHLAVVGESFGGTCALGAYDQGIDALALLWPAIWLLETEFGKYTDQTHAEQAHQDGGIDIDGKRVGPQFIDDLLQAPDRSAELAQITAPTLLIHGTDDSDVPVHQSERAFEVLNEPKRLITEPGGEHCLRHPDEQARVVDEVTAWMVRWIG
jgi:uncharacterized protein